MVMVMAMVLVMAIGIVHGHGHGHGHRNPTVMVMWQLSDHFEHCNHYDHYDHALDAKAHLASPSFTGTVQGITKSMVGLGNVDNTSDTNKPIASATQAALDTLTQTIIQGNGIAY